MKNILFLFFILMTVFPLAGNDAVFREMDTLFRQRNYREAYQKAKTALLALPENSDSPFAAKYYRIGDKSLVWLNRLQDQESLRSLVMQRFPQNLSILESLKIFSHGYLIDGKLHRDRPRGYVSGYVDTCEHDRVLLIRHILQAKKKFDAVKGEEQGRYYSLLSGYFRKSRNQSFLLRHKTDLDHLPDYQQERSYGFSKAPVNPDGSPVFYKVPASFEAAANDGERLRYCWHKMESCGSPKPARKAKYEFAVFLKEQFGIFTLPYDLFREYYNDPERVRVLQSLQDHESIAELADGIRRLTLPEEYNYIRLFREIGEYEILADIYVRRLQLDKALECLKKLPRTEANLTKIRSIENPGGMLLPSPVFPAGKSPEITLIYRNARSLKAEVIRLDGKGLYQEYIKGRTQAEQSSPGSLCDLMNDSFWKDSKRVFFRDVSPWKELIAAGKKTAEFSQRLSPRPGHLNTAARITVPVKEVGIYLVRMKLENGPECETLLWISASTLIVHRDKQGASAIFTMADSGTPLAEKTLAWYRFRRIYSRTPEEIKKFGRQRVEVTGKEVKTDASGMVRFPLKGGPFCSNLLVSEDEKNPALISFPDDRPCYSDPAVVERGFFITDRPVYQPGDTVHFTLWRRTPGYGRLPAPGKKAQRRIVVEGPRNIKIFDQKITMAPASFFTGSFKIPDTAPLGRFHISDRHSFCYFQVEEYQKPEYELTVTSPAKPVRTGEKISFHVLGKYYFGAPMADAEVQYKIFRKEQELSSPFRHFFEFLYGKGYWICNSRSPMFFPHDHAEELVRKGSGFTDREGRLSVEIDTKDTAKFGQKDFLYRIEAEIRDESGHTVTGSGAVIAAAKPFRVFLRHGRGFYTPGSVIAPEVSCYTPDGKKMEEGFCLLSLYRRGIGKNGLPERKEKLRQEKFSLKQSAPRFRIEKNGIYELEAEVIASSGKEKVSESLIVRGLTGKQEGEFFSELPVELITDQESYQPGETARILLLTEKPDGSYYVFRRPCRTQETELLKMNGRSAVIEMKITEKDQPNTFIEVLSIRDGKLLSDHKMIPVPPEKKVLKVRLEPEKKNCVPGARLPLRLSLTGWDGKPLPGDFTLTVYDKSLEAVAEKNVAEILPFFWGWKRSFYVNILSQLGRRIRPYKGALPNLPGIWMEWFLPEAGMDLPRGKSGETAKASRGPVFHGKRMRMAKTVNAANAPAVMMAAGVMADGAANEAGSPQDKKKIAVRSNFSDSILWIGRQQTGKDGTALVMIPVPDNLTTWKVRVWALDSRTRVGEGECEFTVSKDLLARLELPRFLVQGDRTDAVAVLHNLSRKDLTVKVSLESSSPAVRLTGKKEDRVQIKVGGHAAVRFPAEALSEGNASFLLSAKAEGQDLNDALKLEIPVMIRGSVKEVNCSGRLNGEHPVREMAFLIPEERRKGSETLTLHVTSGAAGAVLQILPWLCAEDSKDVFGIIHSFLPAVAVRDSLNTLKISLDDLKLKPGGKDALFRDYISAKDKPVFTSALLQKKMIYGEKMLRGMVNSDGGWGWFGGHGECSWADTTASVVDAFLDLQKSRKEKKPDQQLQKGILWLENYAKRRLKEIRKKNGSVSTADALVLKVLARGGRSSAEFAKEVYERRKDLSPCGLSYLANAFPAGSPEKQMLLRNLRQYLVRDPENGTAYLRIPAGFGFFWFGNENETNSAFLEALLTEEPRDPLCTELAAYLTVNILNSPWRNSTRAAGAAVRTLAKYMVRFEETEPDLSLIVKWDGYRIGKLNMTKKNVHEEQSLSVPGDLLTSGRHVLRLQLKGRGCVFCAAVFACFSLEKQMKPEGKEMRLARNYYRLVPKTAESGAAGKGGSYIGIRREFMERRKLAAGEKIQPGDLLEVELVTTAKNDYDYVMISDPVPAGMEYVKPVSGYLYLFTPVYCEYRTREARFYLRTLPRGIGNIVYQLRAKLPGIYTALPATGKGVYAPVLGCNTAMEEFRLSGN